MSADKPPGGGKPILLVDDNLDLQEALRDVLEEAGYATASARNGRKALEYLRSHDAPGVILLDIMMPEMDGMQFRAEQLRDPALAEIPVVILSADGKLDQKLKELAPAGCLRKPVQLDDLLDTVERFCGAPSVTS